MRVRGEKNVRWNPETELSSSRSWVTKIANFDEVIALMNLSGEYEKNTPIIARSVSYHAKIGSIAEQIQICGKNRFRTITEVLRVAMHLGINILYHIYCIKNAKNENVYGAVFFKNLEIAEERGKLAKIASEFVNQIKECEKNLRNGTMTVDEVSHILTDLYNVLPENSKNYVQHAIKEQIPENHFARITRMITY